MENTAAAPHNQMSMLKVTPSTTLAVIPTLNEARHIETCIRSLMTGSSALRGITLIVADGGSTDNTRDIVRDLQDEFPNLRLVENPKRFQSAALNLVASAMSSGGTDILIRCDAHSIYPDNFLLDVANSLRRANAASLVVPMDATGTTCFQKANAWIVDTFLGSGGSVHRGGRHSKYVEHGHHAAFDFATYRKLGGYDESFTHNEDAEYDHRVRQYGGRIFMDAGIRIKYIPRGTVKALSKQYFNYGKGRLRTLMKHRTMPQFRQLLPIIALLGSLAGLLVGPIYPPALILPIGYLALLASTSILVAVWKRSFCGLLAGVASGTMHVSWAAGFLLQFARQAFETKKVK